MERKINMYKGQHLQDQYLDEYFRAKERGRFIDIGAHDGKTISNSWFFETQRSWDGICVEPNAALYPKLQYNRKAICHNVACSNHDGKAMFTQVIKSDKDFGHPMDMLSGLTDLTNQHDRYRNDLSLQRLTDAELIEQGYLRQVEVEVVRLQRLIEPFGLYYDFCSIDTEGAELQVLQGIDFYRTNIEVFVVENNEGSKDVYDFLTNKGYHLIHSVATDEFYSKKI
jgi:FkbM family methyltransferase